MLFKVFNKKSVSLLSKAVAFLFLIHKSQAFKFEANFSLVSGVSCSFVQNPQVTGL